MRGFPGSPSSRVWVGIDTNRSRQLALLLIRQPDVLASPASRPNAVLEPGQRHVLRLAASHEAAEAVQVGEPVVARPGADDGAAIVLSSVAESDTLKRENSRERDIQAAAVNG
jgi:hypothetical protein